jgi:hypothetical protein
LVGGRGLETLFGEGRGVDNGQGDKEIGGGYSWCVKGFGGWIWIFWIVEGEEGGGWIVT